jgi:hypothetical protein
MKRVMTGVGIEPTTYGLKERRWMTTCEAFESAAASVRGWWTTVKTPEPRPNAGAVCDGMCMGLGGAP